jgi:hypothetical protein
MQLEPACARADCTPLWADCEPARPVLAPPVRPAGEQEPPSL